LTTIPFSGERSTMFFSLSRGENTVMGTSKTGTGEISYWLFFKKKFKNKNNM
jgi:hypothetical protein